jgi:hypothetical protein
VLTLLFHSGTWELRWLNTSGEAKMARKKITEAICFCMLAGTIKVYFADVDGLLLCCYFALCQPGNGSRLENQSTT